MNVVMVTLNLEVGGLERVVVDLALALKALKHKVSVVTLRGGGPLATPLTDAGVVVRSLDCGDGLKFAYARQLGVQLQELEPDLVHSHGEAALFYSALNRLLPWLAPRFAHVHSRHGYEDVSRKGILRNRLSHMGCDQVVCVSEDLERHCRDVERVPATALHTVINGVDLSPYRALESLGWREGAPVIGHVARLAPVKNQALLLRAFALVNQVMPAAQLLIVGDGPERSRLESLADELTIAGAVTFFGETSDVPAQLATTHIFCLSSDSEGTPVSVIEALAAGRPVVATDVGGLAALVPETAGALAVAGDAQALADALLRVYAGATTYAAYCAGARGAPAGSLDAQSMLASYQQIYDLALASQTAR